LTAKTGSLLDLSANLGYFCHKFEELGFDCTAVGNSERTRYLLKKLRRAGNKQFSIIEKSLFEGPEIVGTHYDIIHNDGVLADFTIRPNFSAPRNYFAHNDDYLRT